MYVSPSCMMYISPSYFPRARVFLNYTSQNKARSAFQGTQGQRQTGRSSSQGTTGQVQAQGTAVHEYDIEI